MDSLRMLAAVLAVTVLMMVGCAGCSGPVRDMTVCRADWEQVRPGQVGCTADGQVEIVGKGFDPDTGRYWLKVRTRW
ncbi:MAG: hypothetical protein BIFFINMI_00629 [Phycisphaerae bacterium]|nr:hypothetical protein [Phycisphaerae bacterium]